MNNVHTIQTSFVFETSQDMATICGVNNENIEILESLLQENIYMVGNQLRIISHNMQKIDDFKRICKALQESLQQGIQIDSVLVKTLFNQLTGQKNTSSNQKNNHDTDNTQETSSSQIRDNIRMLTIPTSNTKIIPKTQGQRDVIDSFEENLLSFLVGPAGTGKTYLATAYALFQILSKKKQHYIITRPVLEAGERLGFLPGDLEQKILPYLRPIYDVLFELVGETTVHHLQENKQLEIAPLAYMRGRTLKNAVVLLDEAQNCSPSQMRMFLTRLGEGSIGIVTGDLTQSDLSSTNGLEEAINIFQNVNHVNTVMLSEQDIQRSKLAKIIIDTYNKGTNYGQ